MSAGQADGAEEHIDWFDHRRLHGETGSVPPAGHEGTFHRRNPAVTTVAEQARCLENRPDAVISGQQGATPLGHESSNSR